MPLNLTGCWEHVTWDLQWAARDTRWQRHHEQCSWRPLHGGSSRCLFGANGYIRDNKTHDWKSLSVCMLNTRINRISRKSDIELKTVDYPG